MRILLLHNRYQQRGGEDVVFEREAQLLRDAGHEVEAYERHNDEIAGDGISAARLALQTLWSRRTVSELTALTARFRPDVAHVHNTFPLISPSVYSALKNAGVPIVQTLHNYRLVCLNAMLLRACRPCEDCVGRLPWRGVVRGCYQGSPSRSAVLATTLAVHRTRTISRHVDRFIALTEFGRRLFIRAGLPAQKIVVKPNFVPDQAPPREVPREGVLYVGRLSEEKGIATLAQAARLAPQVRIDVIGDGPCAQMLEGIPNVTMQGRRESEYIRQAMTAACFLVVPSLCYENFPLTIVEAFEAGLPVIASEHGALAEIVSHGSTGYLFPPGNAEALAGRFGQALRCGAEVAHLGSAARRHYEAAFTGVANLAVLNAIYRSVNCQRQ